MSAHPHRSGWAGVDVGGSGIRVRVQSTDRCVDAGRDLVLPRIRGKVDLAQLCSYVLAEIQPLMTWLDLTGLHAVALGMTGLPGLVPDPAEIAHRLQGELDVPVVVVAGDALTTHLGALSGQPGAVVAAGTGVISLGTDLAEIWHQVDGWGLFVGDEGSGAWIGQRGLQAALRAFDGRPGGSPVLAEQMHARYGRPLDLVERIHGAQAPAGELATFAPEVAEAARAGDPVALSIWYDAGARLGDAAVAAARDLPARITWGGGLFRAGDLLIDPFRVQVQRLLPEAELREPAGTGLDGALLLAQRAGAGEVQARDPYLQIFTHRGQA